MSLKKILLLGSALLSFGAAGASGAMEGHAPGTPRADWSFRDARLIPVQGGGRVKPLDSFAREAVLFATGSKSWKGDGRSWDPLDMVFSWIAFPQHWDHQKFIQVSRLDVRRQVGLDENRTRYSPRELWMNPTLAQYADKIDSGPEQQSKIIGDGRSDAREQELRRVLERMAFFRGIVSGEGWSVIPRPSSKAKPASSPWSVLAGKDPEGNPIRAQFALMLKAYLTGDRAMFESAARGAREIVELAAVGTDPKVLAAEVLYNRLHPFQIAWILYLLAAILWIVARPGKSRWAAWLATILAFTVHVVGFGLRCYVAGRPPVTNMYESIVWVMFGVVVFAAILYAMQRQAILMIVACVLATAGLVAADAAPALMDPGLHPLVPVLRSNYWLTIHVLTITLGYAAFALTLGLANVTLFHYLRKGEGWVGKAAGMNQLTYRAMQFGVVLLAAGTILGGIWADYSWGRFWGWDPKETWALIALLCYLVILHGRYTQWVGQFGFAVWSIVGFLSVLMAWYGVNFILGAGLHSYGFSSGGSAWVSGFTALQLAYVGIAAFSHRRAKARPAPLSR